MRPIRASRRAQSGAPVPRTSLHTTDLTTDDLLRGSEVVARAIASVTAGLRAAGIANAGATCAVGGVGVTSPDGVPDGSDRESLRAVGLHAYFEALKERTRGAVQGSDASERDACYAARAVERAVYDELRARAGRPAEAQAIPAEAPRDATRSREARIAAA